MVPLRRRMQVAEAKGLKFVGTDAFEDFYKLQQLKQGGKMQRKTGGSLLLKEKIMREAEVCRAVVPEAMSTLQHLGVSCACRC